MKVQLKKVISAKKNTSENKTIKCEFCDCKCKKNITLKKHMAKNNNDHNGDDNALCPSEDEIFSLSEIKKPEADNEKRKKSFVFSKSTLDEFDPWLK